MDSIPTLDDMLAARKRIRPYVHRTPVLKSRSLDADCGADLRFKCENFQKMGAFKARGAVNAVFSLGPEALRRGVATHSSGNHAAALAYAAGCRGMKAYVVVPSNAPSVKRAAVARYGAEITLCEPTLAAREAALGEVVERTGAVFIPPYNDYRVICGAATAALELCEEVPDLDTVIAPVGGGGLLSGTALACAAVRPQIRVLAGEPQGADDAWRSLKAGKIQPVGTPQTIADGLRTQLGTLTFPIIRKYVSGIVTVSDEAIIEAMRCVWERMKIVVEPSGVVPLAAVMAKRSEIPGKKIGIILSGGNVDLDHLPWMT